MVTLVLPYTVQVLAVIDIILELLNFFTLGTKIRKKRLLVRELFNDGLRLF